MNKWLFQKMQLREAAPPPQVPGVVRARRPAKPKVVGHSRPITAANRSLVSAPAPMQHVKAPISQSHAQAGNVAKQTNSAQARLRASAVVEQAACGKRLMRGYGRGKSIISRAKDAYNRLVAGGNLRSGAMESRVSMGALMEFGFESPEMRKISSTISNAARQGYNRLGKTQRAAVQQQTRKVGATEKARVIAHAKANPSPHMPTPVNTKDVAERTAAAKELQRQRQASRGLPSTARPIPR